MAEILPKVEPKPRAVYVPHNITHKRLDTIIRKKKVMITKEVNK